MKQTSQRRLERFCKLLKLQNLYLNQLYTPAVLSKELALLFSCEVEVVFVTKVHVTCNVKGAAGCLRGRSLPTAEASACFVELLPAACTARSSQTEPPQRHSFNQNLLGQHEASSRPRMFSRVIEGILERNVSSIKSPVRNARTLPAPLAAPVMCTD